MRLGFDGFPSGSCPLGALLWWFFGHFSGTGLRLARSAAGLCLGCGTWCRGGCICRPLALPVWQASAENNSGGGGGPGFMFSPFGCYWGRSCPASITSHFHNWTQAQRPHAYRRLRTPCTRRRRSASTTRRLRNGFVASARRGKQVVYPPFDAKQGARVPANATFLGPGPWGAISRPSTPPPPHTPSPQPTPGPGPARAPGRLHSLSDCTACRTTSLRPLNVIECHCHEAIAGHQGQDCGVDTRPLATTCKAGRCTFFTASCSLEGPPSCCFWPQCRCLSVRDWSWQPNNTEAPDDDLQIAHPHKHDL